MSIPTSPEYERRVTFWSVYHCIRFGTNKKKARSKRRAAREANSVRTVRRRFFVLLIISQDFLTDLAYWILSRQMGWSTSDVRPSALASEADGPGLAEVSYHHPSCDPPPPQIPGGLSQFELRGRISFLFWKSTRGRMFGHQNRKKPRMWMGKGVRVLVG